MTNKYKSLLAGTLLGLGLLASSQASANSITYYLDDANWKSLLPDDNFYYASVTIDDEGVAGLINFTVDVNPAKVTAGTGAYGIDTFAFNTTYDPNVLDDCNLGGQSGDCNVSGTSSFLNLNPVWKADVIPPDNNETASFGFFDVRLSDSNMPLPQLTFSVDAGAFADTILDYGEASHGAAQAPDVNSWFAVHVRSIETGLFFDGSGSCTQDDTMYSGGVGDPCQPVTSAWFGGGDTLVPPATVVPVPAAVWLFGSGLLGLVGVARRRKV